MLLILEKKVLKKDEFYSVLAASMLCFLSIAPNSPMTTSYQVAARYDSTKRGSNLVAPRVERNVEQRRGPVRALRKER
jgi:hypothetical protein